jgi:LysR family transcriptional regulator, nitrogen assimilation regulatory protein
MDLRQLRYFVKVVDCGNVTRASAALYVAQSAVSNQISNLERELEMPLLERSVRGVAPTAAGQTLNRHALELLRLAHGTRNLLRQDAETPQGRVSVGMVTTLSRVFAIPLARTVRERYPGIVLELVEVPSTELGKLLSAGRLELAVVPDHAEAHGVASQRLIREALYLIAWPTFPIPDDPVPLDALARMPLILPSWPNTTRTRVDLMLREAGLLYEVCLEATSTETILAAVIAKLGVAILPWPAVQPECDAHKIKVARINHRHAIRDLSLCWHDTQVLSNAVQKVKAIILEIFELLGRRPEWAANGRVARAAAQTNIRKTARAR